MAAQNIYVFGFLYQEKIGFPIVGADVYLLKEDSTVVTQTKTEMDEFNHVNRPGFMLSKVSPGNYILKFVHPNYETKTQNLNLDGKEDLVTLAFTYLTPKKRTKDKLLNEAVVTATRIKMFHKGDTLVFNADAFNLAEGSMLDALVEELPGVQLKPDGQIFVNGKKVDELLLNGKDFFRGDRLVLLENLPAFMVKNVKVFEKQDPYRQSLDKTLAMDVVLKKEYREGWIANVEMAGGTDDRFLTRTFGLRFTDHSRLSAFANLNNINDNRKPGQSGDWENSDIFSGVQKTLKAGIDFYTEDMLGTWRFNTVNEIEDTRNHRNIERNHVSFLPTYDTYQKGLSRNKNSRTAISSKNRLNWDRGPKNSAFQTLRSQFDLNFKYNTWKSNEISKELESDIDTDTLSNSLSLDRLLELTPESEIYSRLLNRNTYSSAQEGYKLGTDGAADFQWIKANMYGQLTMNYDRQSTKSYSKQTLDYPASDNPEQYIHRYQKTPMENFGADAQVTYKRMKSHFWPIFTVDYNHQYSSADRSLFNLDRLTNWQRVDDRQLKELPSTRDSMQMAMDIRNSYDSKVNEDRVTLSISPVIFFHPKRGGEGNFSLDLPLQYYGTHLKYKRNTIDTLLTRDRFYLNPTFRIEFTSKRAYMRFNYTMSTTAPSLVYKLDIQDDVDPLNTIMGNKSLKDTRHHHFEAYWSRRRLSHYGALVSQLSYNIIRNALAMGFLYDTETGVRTTHPDNVNGNWDIGGRTDFSRCIDKKDRLTLDTHTRYSYTHSVDLTGTEQIERSVVRTFALNEEMSLKYKIGKNTVGLNGKVSWSNINSHRDNFETMNIADFGYGVNAQIQLPWKLQFATDLTMYSRRGYNDHSMNTNELVWNARLSRTFLHGNLTCFIDGFDILGNLSNVQRYVNAQGRTETRYNVVPSYAMLHVLYKFAKKPKK